MCSSNFKDTYSLYQDLTGIQGWKPVMDGAIYEAAKRGRGIMIEGKRKEKYQRVWSEASQLAAAKGLYFHAFTLTQSYNHQTEVLEF